MLVVVDPSLGDKKVLVEQDRELQEVLYGVLVVLLLQHDLDHMSRS